MLDRKKRNGINVEREKTKELESNLLDGKGREVRERRKGRKGTAFDKENVNEMGE